MFNFGVLMADVFNVERSTKLHRVILHEEDDLVHLGCILRGSSEEKDATYKELKALCNYVKWLLI